MASSTMVQKTFKGQYYMDPLSKLRFNEFIGTRTLRFSHSSTVVTCTVPTMLP